MPAFAYSISVRADGTTSMVTLAEFIEFDPDSSVPEPQEHLNDELSIFMETLPAIRNTYAHGSSLLHLTVLGTFEIVTDLVNQLYPAYLLSKE